MLSAWIEQWVLRLQAYNFTVKYLPGPSKRESAIDQDAIQSGKLSKFPKEYKTVSSQLTVLGKLVLQETQLVIPCVLRKRVLNLAHKGHQGIVKTKHRHGSKVWEPGIDQDAESKSKTTWLPVGFASSTPGTIKEESFT